MLQVNKLTRIVLVKEIRYIMYAWYIVNSDLSETILCWGYMEAVNGTYIRMVFIFLWVSQFWCSSCLTNQELERKPFSVWFNVIVESNSCTKVRHHCTSFFMITPYYFTFLVKDFSIRSNSWWNNCIRNNVMQRVK